MSNNEISVPINNLAKDLGIELENMNGYDINNIFKEGTSPMIFLTKVSNVYSNNYYLEKENSRLTEKNNDLEKQLKESHSQILTLQKSEIILKKDNEILTTYNQNSLPGTILFSIGSIFIGICGGYINAKSYITASITGILGILLSILASVLINKKSKMEVK